MAALLFYLASPLPAQEKPALLEAHLQVFQPACSSANLHDVRAAVREASHLLQNRCQLRLKWVGSQALPLDGPWCSLPDAPAQRSERLRALARSQKAAHPRRLGLFLLPSAADPRLSWALVDQSLRSACDSPQEARFLARFGSFFVTDLTWMLAPTRSASLTAGSTIGPSPASLLVAHEVLHALTQRQHPTGVARGGVMADHVADMGPQIGDDWCACARSSPYLRKP